MNQITKECKDLKLSTIKTKRDTRLNTNSLYHLKKKYAHLHIAYYNM